MTKSQIFTLAHRLAHQSVEFVGNYSLALSFALREVYRSIEHDELDDATVLVVDTDGSIMGYDADEYNDNWDLYNA